jgi:hypothetical protein
MKFLNFFRITVILGIGILAILIVSCKSNSMKGMIIITEVPLNTPQENYITGEGWRYTEQARIMAINPDKPSEAPILLSGDYYSARVAEISFDGESLLFTAQQKKGDAWQIYEMHLSNKSIRKVIALPENCIDPAYLPGDRAVFSRSLAKDSTGAGHALFTIKLDGSDLKRISFHPSVEFASYVMADGRILAIEKQLISGNSEQSLQVFRPDGTKSDLFYSTEKGNLLYGRPTENESGTVLFVELPNDSPQSGTIISVNQNRPLHSRKNVSEGIKGGFLSINPLSSNKYMVSYRSEVNNLYALCEFDLQTRTIGKTIFSDPKYSIEDAVFAEAHERPKKLPSEVDYKVKTGLLLCQDINIRDEAADFSKKVTSFEMQGLNSTSLGIVNVEEDGSFYLKVIADKPFRIQALDEKGNAIGKPCTWLWMRPNERRGCVGCHENHDLVPENKVPLSVKKSPVSIPVHIKGIKEKQVTLE